MTGSMETGSHVSDYVRIARAKKSSFAQYFLFSDLSSDVVHNRILNSIAVWKKRKKFLRRKGR